MFTTLFAMEESIVYKTPLGPLKLVAKEEGICAVKWLFGKHTSGTEQAKIDPPVTEKESDVPASKPQEHLSVCTRWLDAYFGGYLLASKPPVPRPHLVLPEKAPFHHRVWDTLIASGVGETLTYKELAKLSGNPNAARAAGRAVNSHCLPILVPCHRVVKSSAATRKSVVGGEAVPYEIGQYSGGDGTETKRWLLEHEKKMVQDARQSQ